ncbi:phage tail protein [Paenibacillus pini]|uniref:Microcystin dependent protein n=1 Tax=Paenibacillus pini JCM 16418 TaxID=1236976 RepID=W7YLG9_9BACL|nr:tail fiber protein [Paenibacillus pini]GAF09422.1 microcystin dependent protein [Paenibacillus pini JCM 16418]
MSESYVGEIRMFAGNYAPQGWALCNGQTMSINENEILYVLLGTTYGGDGQQTFNLPDLRGRVAVHPFPNQNIVLGSKQGTETATLTTAQLAPHTHVLNACASNGQNDSPENSLWSDSLYSSYIDPNGKSLVDMNDHALSSVGENQPHDNMMPTTAISFIISLYGIFPSQP